MSGISRRTPGRRTYPPGQQGPRAARRRRRVSDYAVHLIEKQKLRYYYGLTESQMRIYLKRASRSSDPTGEVLLRLLELRLDNVAFRLGLAPTIPAARQLVRHGHVRVNGKKVTIPSFSVSPRDHIDARPGSRSHPLIAEGATRGPQLGIPSYLKKDEDGFGGTCTSLPLREDTPVEIDESLVIEYYAG